MFATSPIENVIYLVMTCAILCIASDSAVNTGANH